MKSYKYSTKTHTSTDTLSMIKEFHPNPFKFSTKRKIYIRILYLNKTKIKNTRLVVKTEYKIL